MDEPRWLDLRDVLRLHASLLEAYGGAPGLRDLGLLLCAIEQPRAMFDGRLLHRDRHEQAAASLFHLVLNHPFVDGNKRLGAASAVVLLDLNGVSLAIAESQLVTTTLGVANGILDKAAVTTLLRRSDAP